jgi:hypothetical protein
MAVKLAITLALSLATSGVVAGCAPGDGPATAGGAPPAPGIALTCGSVVDSTGYENGPLTANLAVASLTAMQLAGGAASISRGRPTGAVTRTLDVMSVELMGYAGSKLSADAQAFAVAELNYNPDGPVDTSYARPLEAGILALESDCPDGTRLGRRWHGAGG